MKKLALLVLLLAMAALPLMAQVALSGEFEFGFATDFGDNYAEGFGVAPDYNFFKIAAKVDDFNTVNAEFYMDPAAATNIRFLYLSHDLAGVLGVKGTGIKLDIGQLRAANERYSVGGYWSDRAYSFRPGYRPTIDLVISPMKLFNVEAAFTPNALGGGSEADQTIWLGAYGTFGTISAEAYYFNQEVTAPAGQIGVAAKVALPVASLLLVPSFFYDLNDAAAIQWQYGVGLSAGMGMASGTVNLKGNDVNTLSRLAATVTLKPIEKVTLNAGAMFNMDETAVETFDNFGVAASYAAGAATLQLGYLYTKTGAAAGGPGWFNGPVAGPDGGLMFDVTIDFK